MLMRYDFPGNVRELRNIVERWAVLGATAARAGGAPMLRGAARVVFWSSLAMVATATIGRLIGT